MFKVDRKKHKIFSRDDLSNLSKEELVDMVLQLQANNVQLKNVITKGQVTETKMRGNRKGREFDFSRYHTRRIFLRIAYLGSNYRGLAVQEDCPDTIEAHLFNALITSCLIKSREESFYDRCGRTDKGVSASGQVLSIQVRSRLTLEELNSENGGCNKELQYCKILNRLLPDDIRAISWAPAPLRPDGEYRSARFDCKQRTYKYWFPKGTLDIDRMRGACKYLIGSHDFRNLCKMDVANGVTNFIRDLTHASIEKGTQLEISGGYDMFYLLIKSNAFLWHQIRCIAAVLFLIGKGNEEPNIILHLLDVKTNPRKPQYNMAVDLPLNLFHCEYEFLQNSKSNPETSSFSGECSKINSKEAQQTVDSTGPLGNNKKRWSVDHEELTMIIKTFQSQWTKASIKASMIRDIIEDLKCLIDSIPIIDNELQHHHFTTFSFQSDSLLEGVKPKVYQPLLKRIKCESLENRIDHYVKKKRLKMMTDAEETDDVK